MSNLPSPKIEPLRYSQQLISVIANTLKENAPKAYKAIDDMLEILGENLDIGIKNISYLEECLEVAKDNLTHCEWLACDLLEDIDELKKYDPDLTARSIADIAEELYDQVEDIYDTASQGVDL